MPTSIAAHVLRKQMALDGADPFQIAADALLRIAALETQLAHIQRSPALWAGPVATHLRITEEPEAPR